MKLKSKEAIGILTIALMVSLTFNARSVYIASLQDKGNGGPNNVTFILFKYHETVPEWNLIWNGAWKIISWNSDGITYQASAHNGMTNCYVNFLQYQLASSTPNMTTPTLYIALSTNSTAPTTADQKTRCVLEQEVTGNSLDRASATITLNQTALSNLVVKFRAAKVFTASGTQTNIYTAGLGTRNTGTGAGQCPVSKYGCFIAISALPNTPINLSANDQLTVQWDNQWTGT